MSWAKRTRLMALSVLLLCVALAGGACGDDSGGGGSGEPATLNVGVIPIADVAPLYLGMDKGFFKDEKLTIKPKLAEGGAAIVPAVVSGDDQIGFSNTTSLIIAGSRNLPVQIVSQGVLGAAKPTAEEAWDAVVVKGDSSIESPKDLEGKTIAVNTLQNVGPLTINTALKTEGVDYESVKYVEVPFPDMNAAVEAGRVDAAWVVEPFVSQGKAEGYRTVLFPYEQTEPNLTVATYFASKQYIAENEDVVDRFTRAMDKSLEYADAHPDEVRDIVTTYTEIPADAAQKINLPQWRADLNEPSIEKTADLAKEYGFVEEKPDLGELIRAR